MSSGSKKGTQIYFFFSVKNPGKQTSSKFPNRATMKRDTHLQGICVSLKNLIKIPLNKNALKKKRPLHVPQKQGPYGSRRLFLSLA
jgi:hypothetical protein